MCAGTLDNPPVSQRDDPPVCRRDPNPQSLIPSPYSPIPTAYPTPGTVSMRARRPALSILARRR